MNRRRFRVRTWIGMVVLAATPFAGAASAPRPFQDDALSAKLYDLRSIAPAAHVGEYVATLAPLLDFDGGGSTQELESESGADAVARALSFLFEAELSAPGRELRIESPGRVRIVAPAAVHRQIDQALAALAAPLRRTHEVRLDLLERPAGTPVQGGIVSAAEAEKLLAAGVRRSFTLRVPSGRVGVLDATSLRRVVSDYDAEVAELALHFTPRMASLRTGVHFAVRASEVTGGVQLALSAIDAQLGALRERVYDLSGLLSDDSGATVKSARVPLELPTLLALSGGFNVFVPAGQAAVIDSALALESGASRRTWIVRCASSGAQPATTVIGPPPRSARVQLLDTGWVQPPHALPNGSASGFESVADARESEWAHGGERELSVQLSAAPLTELLAGWNDRSVELLTLGPFVMALQRGASPELSLGGPEAGPLVAPQAASLTWTLKRKGERDLTLAAGAAPLLLGETSAWIHGAQSRLVLDARVEVASRVSTLAPRVSNALDGLVVWARPSRAADGGLDCEIAVAAHVLAAPLGVVLVGAPLTLELDHPQWNVLSVHETLRAPATGPAKFTFQGGGNLELELELR
jgi:hypothetical protein